MKLIRLMCMLACMLLLCGCMNPNIREDEIRSDLPALDPQAGVAKSIDVTCYYQLLREPYLYGAVRTLEVHANERAEHAIVNALLEGAQAFEGLNGLFPAGTSIVDITMEGGILYVTLSEEFMDESALRRTLNELENALEQDRYTQAEYEALVRAAEQSALDMRRLALYSLVNTLAGYDDDMRVLLLVDRDGAGVGERITQSALGMGTEDALVEPMSFVQGVAKTETDTVDLALAHMQAGDYVSAYSLFADTSGDNTPRPQYDVFEGALRELGTLQSYAVNSNLRDADGEMLYASVDMTFVDDEGKENAQRGRHLPVRKQGMLYKLDYAAFITALGGK